MNSTIFHLSSLTRGPALLSWLMFLVSAQAATLSDFGYKNMTRNGVQAIGDHPLLVIVVNFAGVPALRTTNINFFADWVFPISNTVDTVNGYFDENSNHRFRWTRAGVVGPLNRPEDERIAGWQQRCVAAGQTNDVHLPERLFFSNVVAQTMIAGLFSFAPYDNNPANGVVEDGELGILIFDNNGNTEGANRPTERVKAGASTVAVQMIYATEVNHYATLNVLVHETAHILTTLDLYGSYNLSANLSLMAGTTNRGVYHLDPWHKMQLGWSPPRIRELQQGGRHSMQAVNFLGDDCLLLYDPAHGIREFFLLEYRSRVNPPGANSRYDRDVAGNGLVIWHIEHGADKFPINVNDEYRTVYSKGAPDLAFGGNTVWTNGMTTPSLRWRDGTATPVSVYVHPFTVGDASITIEWLNPTAETWVDFGYAGIEEGTFSRPFNTIAEGASGVAWGGTLNIKTGRSPEAAGINRRMRLQSYNGPVVIGR